MNHRCKSVLSLLIFLAVSSPAISKAESTPAGKGELSNFSLLDYKGRQFELRRADARFVVLFFTSGDCPIGRQMAPKLQAISDEFATKGVMVRLVNAMPQNDPNDQALDVMFAMGRYAPKKVLGDRNAVNGLRDLIPESALGDRLTLRRETMQYVFGVPPLPPVLRDEHQLVSQYFGITRTCETVVIDTKTFSIVYRGAVDDQFSEGARKPQAANNYLHDALTELLAGRAPAEMTTQAHGCRITYDGPKGEDISYSRDVAPILQARCMNCHSQGNIGPFPMSSYQKVKGWSAMIQEVLLDKRMPPWHADPHFGKFWNDRSLTAAQSQTLTRWIAAGCPRGEGDDPLEAASANMKVTADSVAAWTLGEPDFVVKIPKQDVPATGVLDYRFIDAEFVAPRDMWLRAAITRPGEPKVVHHIIVRMRRPAGDQGPPSDSYLFTTWVPGLGQGEFPTDTGVFVPKGASFNFEVHYTTDGNPHTDESQVGLYVAKTPAKMQIEVRAAQIRDLLEIPPGDSNAQHNATYFFKRDSILFGLAPHMHLRGSWMKFELMEPDGHKETLLSVPAYDFNWQTSYRLAQPRHVPAGSWMLCTGGFDNSTKNPHNPDPTRRVTWGLQTANEMFMGFLDLAELPDAHSATSAVPADPAKTTTVSK